jgi:hypothetical protein
MSRSALYLMNPKGGVLQLGWKLLCILGVLDSLIALLSLAISYRRVFECLEHPFQSCLLLASASLLVQAFQSKKFFYVRRSSEAVLAISHPHQGRSPPLSVQLQHPCFAWCLRGMCPIGIAVVFLMQSYLRLGTANGVSPANLEMFANRFLRQPSKSGYLWNTSTCRIACCLFIDPGSYKVS